jgi:hypothetical protein
VRLLVRIVGYTELASNGLGVREAWARKLLGMEDGVVNVWPELPEHNGHSIERGI